MEGQVSIEEMTFFFLGFFWRVEPKGEKKGKPTKKKKREERKSHFLYMFFFSHWPKKKKTNRLARNFCSTEFFLTYQSSSFCFRAGLKIFLILKNT